MDPLLIAVVVGIVALAGLLLGWWIGGRPAAGLRSELDQLRADRDAQRTDGESWRQKFNEAAVNLAAEAEKSARSAAVEEQLAAAREALAAARSEADGLRPVAARVPAQEAELLALRAEKEALEKTKAAYERGEAERQRAHDAQLAQLKELEAKVETRFTELASKAVDGAHARFLTQASERFGHAEKQSEEKLKALLQPVESTLKRYDEKLDQIEKARNASYGELQAAVRLLHDGHSQVRDETRNLVHALRSGPKVRGNWGERSLKNVLEQAGLSEHIDFQTEVSTDTSDGRFRPDVIVRLPGGRKLIIDAKCSLNAFLDASDESDDKLRTEHLKKHVSSIKRHVEQLGSKAYWSQFADSADYVVMYIPGEHFLSAALEQAQKDDTGQDLWTWAFDRRVLLATPTNLVAIARTVSTVWRQEKLAEEAAEIAKLGRELHSRLATMTGHLSRLGRNLELAAGAYNQTIGSFESQVLTQARRFEAHGAGSAKEILSIPAVEVGLRPLLKGARAASGENQGVAGTS